MYKNGKLINGRVPIRKLKKNKNKMDNSRDSLEVAKTKKVDQVARSSLGPLHPWGRSPYCTREGI